MRGKTLMRLGVAVVAIACVIGVIGLIRIHYFGQPEYPGLIIYGAIGMFGAMFAFVLAFIHVALISQRGQ
jgi:hypothetical protein